MIVVLAPGLDLLSGILQRQEPVLVQALLAQPPVERLDQSVFNGLPGADEVQLYAIEVCSLIQALRLEPFGRLRTSLRSVVNTDAPRQAALCGDPLEDFHNPVATEAPVDLDR